MAYVATLLAALVVFLFATPAHTALEQAVRKSIATISGVATAPTSTIQGRLDQLRASAHEKTMELLREQLHRAVDSLAR